MQDITRLKEEENKSIFQTKFLFSILFSFLSIKSHYTNLVLHR